MKSAVRSTWILFGLHRELELGGDSDTQGRPIPFKPETPLTSCTHSATTVFATMKRR